MKTPSQTAEYLKQKDDKAAVKSLKERERHLQKIRKELTDIVNRAIDEGKITENGGGIVYHNFYQTDSEEGLADIKELFRQNGWECRYQPQTDSSYSINCTGITTSITHYFNLTPLKDTTKTRISSKGARAIITG